MTQDPRKIIIEYPEAFPVTGPLREVFTERLRTFFDGCSTWSCSLEGSLPEKLLKLREEMQESIGYPPSLPSNLKEDGFGVIEPCAISFIVLPEELLSWKGLQVKSMKDLSPIVRNVGLEMASRILGLQIRYGGTESHPARDEQADGEENPQNPQLIPAMLCPVAPPGRIGALTGGWSDREAHILQRSVHRHMAGAAIVALIVGIFLGAAFFSHTRYMIVSDDGGLHRSMGGTTPRHHVVSIPVPSLMPGAVAPGAVAPGAVAPGAAYQYGAQQHPARPHRAQSPSEIAAAPVLSSRP